MTEPNNDTHAQAAGENPAGVRGSEDLGPLLRDEFSVRADCLLLQRWAIPPDKRPAIVNRLLQIIETTKSERNVIAAVKALAKLDDQNMEQEKKIIGQASPSSPEPPQESPDDRERRVLAEIEDSVPDCDDEPESP